ncbi:hypothetical protein E4T44_00592 [Aureobasidium sp. EXF-8845]|nr:hypothetical protein E4T44_00592 [Aureobasidium sp. EXF-8845]KAI4857957.1 hypothetical protein E4T45_00535 [Aureobasidium sp. EXF-8846]
MAGASSRPPATVVTPSSSTVSTVTEPSTGLHGSAQHDYSTNGSQYSHDNILDSSTKASKDRNCPFCNQAFTSSSLGRHLDLYIKPKDPKPADGIHDVEAIKVMRGSITRRKPRNSLRANANDNSRLQHGNDDGSDRGTPTGQWARLMPITPQNIAGGPSSAAIASPVNLQDSCSSLNTASRQGTGVINNLSSHTFGPSPANRMTVAQIQRPSQIKDHDLQDDVKATKLTLREDPGSLETARRRVPHQDDLTFDFCSMNFPSLCLHVLSAPQTLFSTTPFASSDSWSLDAPSDAQLDAIQRQVSQRVQRGPTPIPEKDARRLQTHLQAAWNNWSPLSDEDKSSIWGMEIMRAFARADQRSKEKNQELVKAKQEIAQLKDQFACPPSTLSEQVAVAIPLDAPATSARNMQTAPAQSPVTSTYDVGASQIPLQNSHASIHGAVSRQLSAHQISDDEDADADADADEDADSEEALSTSTPHWGSHAYLSFSDNYMTSVINTNGKRPPSSFDRPHAKNMKTYHDSPHPPDTDVLGARAVG